ncbi:MAG: TlpA family protein disulfide reductase [Ruminococcaceae bacterium]|nr:TlpA family protein disulfide reductase [Oscillospiraceae bacterium]
MDKKKLIFSVALLALVLVVAYFGYEKLSEDGPVVDVPDTTESNLYAAPDFIVYDMQGNTVALSDMKGKPVIVNFWATWCGPCLSELGHFEEMYKKYGDDVVFMMVDMTDGVQDTEAKVKAFVKEKGYTFPVYLDTKQLAAYTYSVSSIPMTLFINEKGEIVYNYVGAMNAKTLENFITTFLVK